MLFKFDLVSAVVDHSVLTVHASPGNNHCLTTVLSYHRVVLSGLSDWPPCGQFLSALFTCSFSSFFPVKIRSMGSFYDNERYSLLSTQITFDVKYVESPICVTKKDVRSSIFVAQKKLKKNNFFTSSKNILGWRHQLVYVS